jgi:hypothetical protein
MYSLNVEKCTTDGYDQENVALDEVPREIEDKVNHRGVGTGRQLSVWHSGLWLDTEPAHWDIATVVFVRQRYLLINGGEWRALRKADPSLCRNLKPSLPSILPRVNY